METDVMTVHELCDYLRVHRATIDRLLRTQSIPAFRVGADWRFTRARIDEWCVEQQKKPVDFLSIGPVAGTNKGGTADVLSNKIIEVPTKGSVSGLPFFRRMLSAPHG
jgi:excisionase family DNA binding protein